jgi:hypothetical protein
VNRLCRPGRIGEIHLPRVFVPLGVDTIADLYVACRSSGMKIRLQPTDEEIRLSDMAIAR